MYEFLAKRRSCGSRFLVPETLCIWCSNGWKCSLFEHVWHAIDNIKPLQDKETRQR
ncbi:hypothetical protein T03_16765 [Trichinella britovi]|uniref:Uncharacterized protein n=1 Tax=Trichinella britovi TaxID=45882 RepID=A0A0V1AHB6_TRIBR|nr:hypothetical protein T03_16765 [Trichinella britovi]